jgi:cytochrome c biogenesis protein CcmG, thiol:disulfide interchange protein DsbE
MGSTALRQLCAAAAFATAAALASCSGASGTKSAAQGDAHARIGEAAPNWREATAQGPQLAMTSLRGKVVYLNFFATWCPPCNEEAPDIVALQREFGARGLQVVGIDVLENAGKAADFQRAHRLDYPVVVDDGTLRDQYSVNGLPVHVFIDRRGAVRKIVVGELSAPQMRANVVSLLQ